MSEIESCSCHDHQSPASENWYDKTAPSVSVVESLDFLACAMRGIYSDTHHELADKVAFHISSIVDSIKSGDAEIDRVIDKMESLVWQMKLIRSENKRSQD